MASPILNENYSLMIKDPSAIAAAEAAKARIQSAYLMALHKPRNEDQARDAILHACKKPGFAEKVEFSKPVGGKQIKGPSVRLAEVALRAWGNVLTESQVVYEDDTLKRIKLFCTDLENNLTHSKEIVVNKTVERKSKRDREVLGERTNTTGEVVYIVKATDDEIHNKEAALISKALRNEGLRLIPVDIIDEAMETAKETLRSRDKADPDAAKRKILDSFSEIGVKPKDIEQYLGHKTDSIMPKEMEDLRGIYRAIRDGESRWTDYIQPSETEENTKSKADALKEKLKKAKEEENHDQKSAPEVHPAEPPSQGKEEINYRPKLIQMLAEMAGKMENPDAWFIATIKQISGSDVEQVDEIPDADLPRAFVELNRQYHPWRRRQEGKNGLNLKP